MLADAQTTEDRKPVATRGIWHEQGVQPCAWRAAYARRVLREGILGLFCIIEVKLRKILALLIEKNLF